MGRGVLMRCWLQTRRLCSGRTLGSSCGVYKTPGKISSAEVPPALAFQRRRTTQYVTKQPFHVNAARAEFEPRIEVHVTAPCGPSLAQMSIRSGRSSDGSELSRISKGCYEGVDDLPLLFQQFLSDSQKHVVVCEAQDRMLACAIFSVVDDGKTLVSEYFRRDSMILNDGSMAVDVLMACVQKLATESEGCLDRFRGVAVDQWKAGDPPPVGKVICEQVIVEICDELNGHDLTQILAPGRLEELRNTYPQLQRLKQTTSSEMETIFIDQAVVSRLFPQGIVVRESQVFEPMVKQNLRRFQEFEGFSLVSATAGQFDSFSTCSVTTCEKGKRCAVDYYGSDDVTVMVAHVIKCAELLMQAYPDEHFVLALVLASDQLEAEKITFVQDFGRSLLTKPGAKTVKEPMSQHVIELPLGDLQRVKIRQFV